MFYKKVQPEQGINSLSLVFNAYFVIQKRGRRKGQNGCSFFVWEKGHLKISSVSRLGADSSPQGGIPPSALLL